jgi:superfamily II DNA or RNA helicase
VLRIYAEDHIDDRDISLELPTGSGKTLVGLLIAERRRLKLGERTAFVCPTNQLARQIHAKSLGYGIEPVPLTDRFDSPSILSVSKTPNRGPARARPPGRLN